MILLSSFMILNVNGGKRVSFTYDEVDDKTGEPISTNNKKSFYATGEELQGHIAAIFDEINANHI